jgi:hypothetical protein
MSWGGEKGWTRFYERSDTDRDTEILFNLGRVRRFVNIERPALRRLKQLDLGQTN